MKHNESRDGAGREIRLPLSSPISAKRLRGLMTEMQKMRRRIFFKGGLKGDNTDIFLMFVVTVVTDERIPGGSACK